MKMILVLTAISLMSATTCLVAAGNEDDVPDSVKIQGTWTFFEIQRDGKVIKPHEVIVRFTKDEMITTREKKDVKSEYHLDATKNPGHLDQIFTNGEQQSVVRSLYLLEGDTLKICRIQGGRSPNRPTKFEAKPSDSQAIIVLKRVKE